MTVLRAQASANPGRASCCTVRRAPANRTSRRPWLRRPTPRSSVCLRRTWFPSGWARVKSAQRKPSSTCLGAVSTVSVFRTVVHFHLSLTEPWTARTRRRPAACHIPEPCVRSRRLVANLFGLARDRKPSIIFIDEVRSAVTLPRCVPCLWLSLRTRVGQRPLSFPSRSSCRT